MYRFAQGLTMLPRDPEDQAPEDVVRAAKSAFRRDRPPELATVTFDSLIDADDRPEDHRLRFEHRFFMVDLQVLLGQESVTISGTVNPAAPIHALLHFEDSDVPFVSRIVNGRFAFAPVVRGLNRLSFEGGAQAGEVWTDWFRT
jgi:hypothetical protein